MTESRPGGVQDRLACWISDLTTLHDLTERLSRTTGLEEALRETLRAGAGLAGARRGLIALRPSDREAEHLIGLGLGPSELGDIETVPRGSASYARLIDGLLPVRRPAARPGGARGEAGTGEAEDTARGTPYEAPRETAGEAGGPGAEEIALRDIPHNPALHPRHREVAARLGFAASYALPLFGEAQEPDAGAFPGRAARRDGPARPSPSPSPSSSPSSSPSPGAAPLGAAVWLYDEDAQPDERQRHLLALYLRQATQHIANRLELARARQAVREVHDGLLPRRLPHVPGVGLAVRHLCPPDGGGAFYEALPLPENALGLAIGSVSGSGPSAVAAMGRLLAGLRAYAVMEGEDPVAVLSDLELMLRVTELVRSATALFGYAEPAARRIVLASAGHPPPLIVGERRVEFAETTLSAPLGMLACWEAPSVEIEVADGETVLLYSDGLLRRTGEAPDLAAARLTAAAHAARPEVRRDPDALLGHLLHRLAPGPDADPATVRAAEAAARTEDAVLLAVRFPPDGFLHLH
ncbi:PP2C family protein-serine/threonine phosphatase [Streptomyces aidingensis]|uniref:PP2C family protein-serine/threonine phosphatase n=1 Tax=Streptomyces aidingensis TaxID=910347 RepID=UPI0031841791